MRILSQKSQDSFLALPGAFQLHGHLDPAEEKQNKTLGVVFWAVVEWISVSESGLLSVSCHEELCLGVLVHNGEDDEHEI